MKIAIPLAGGRVCQHFGHSEFYAMVAVDRAAGAIESIEMLKPPPHGPGVIPDWLHGLGVDLVIAASMGTRAQQLFHGKGIEVLLGASEDVPEKIVVSYLEGTLESGDNRCDH
jgi:ATP-binding protein involved in chromosome partitioning